jgi:hypothetical protein
MGLYVFGVLKMNYIEISFQNVKQMVLVWLWEEPEHSFHWVLGS